tara:strand:+ start:9 stop:350 length:342 start_codon:yes stop_codon:yes gene_type:complete
MKKLRIKKIILDYFKFFKKKEINKLDPLFSKNIIVHDWENKIKGKKKVINFNKKIFRNFKKIDIKILNLYFNKDNKAVSCQINIKLDKIYLNVIDIIYFNKDYKISKVMAYKL